MDYNNGTDGRVEELQEGTPGRLMVLWLAYLSAD
jgi:hypothetical protein